MLYWFQIPLFAPQEPPPPPTGPEGWNELPYENAWFGQVSHFLTINSAGSPRVVVPPDSEAFERFTYFIFEGKTPSAAPSQ
jgi:hypothetical protein